MSSVIVKENETLDDGLWEAIFWMLFKVLVSGRIVVRESILRKRSVNRKKMGKVPKRKCNLNVFDPTGQLTGGCYFAEIIRMR